MLGGAGVAALLALGALTAGLVALLDTAMATWVAALIVTALWAIAAPSCCQGRAKRCRRRRRRPLRPSRP